MKPKTKVVRKKVRKPKPKKDKPIVWYNPKTDTIIELEAKTSYALIVYLIKWDDIFDRDNFIYLGEL